MPPELGRGVLEALGTASPTCPAKEGRAGVGGWRKRLEGMGQVCAIRGIWGFGPVTCRSRNLNHGRRCEDRMTVPRKGRHRGDIPAGPVAKILSSQCKGAWVQSRIRELDSTCSNQDPE